MSDTSAHKHIDTEDMLPSPARFSETGTSLEASSYVEVESVGDPTYQYGVSELDEMSFGKLSRKDSSGSELTKLQQRHDSSPPSSELEPVEVKTDQALFMSSTTGPVQETPQAESSETTTYDKEFKEIEAQAAKVAKDVQEVARDVSRKLAQGLFSAFGATSATSKITTGLSSWLAPTEESPEAPSSSRGASGKPSDTVTPEMRKLLGLREDETFMEAQPCRLVQTYKCAHNSLTPSIQLVFQGTMYITEWNTCFCGDERGRQVPFKVPHSTITQVERLRMAKGKGSTESTEVVRIDMEEGQHLLFSDFLPEADLDSLMALLEGLLDMDA